MMKNRKQQRKLHDFESTRIEKVCFAEKAEKDSVRVMRRSVGGKEDGCFYRQAL